MELSLCHKLKFSNLYIFVSEFEISKVYDIYSKFIWKVGKFKISNKIFCIFHSVRVLYREGGKNYLLESENNVGGGVR